MPTDSFFGIEEALTSAGINPTAAPVVEQQPAPSVAPEQQPAPVQEQILPADDEIYDDISDYVTDSGNIDVGNEVHQPQQTEVPRQQPTITPEIAALLQQNQALLQQQFAASQKSNEERVAELEAKLRAYEQKPAEEAKKPWYEGIEVPELSKEQLDAYAGSLPVIEAIAARKAVEIAQRLEAERLNPLARQFDETVQPLQAQMQQQEELRAISARQQYNQAIATKLPWLRDAVNTAEYAQYYNAVVPNTGGLTRAALVQNAETVGNVDAVVDLLSGFKPAQPVPQQQLTAPGRSNAINYSQQATAAQPKGKRGMKLSTYNRALQDFSNGKMSPEQFAKYEDAWNTALLNGVAVMD
jgi:hypothetical protein